MSTVKFVAGRTYYGRSICDSDCKYTMLVLRRTRCTLSVSMDGGKNTKTLHVYVYNDVEHVRPNGRYSMALTIGADRELPAPLSSGEAITLEGDTITVEALTLDEVTV